jgi:hypothetical protein
LTSGIRSLSMRSLRPILTPAGHLDNRIDRALADHKAGNTQPL